MEKQFISNKLALQLKELRFNEACLASYYKSKIDSNYQLEYHNKNQMSEENMLTINAYVAQDREILAPLYQQFFHWCRDKHKLDFEIYMNHNMKGKRIYSYQILDLTGNVVNFIKASEISGSYEYVREKGIEALISIVKDRK